MKSVQKKFIKFTPKDIKILPHNYREFHREFCWNLYRNSYWTYYRQHCRKISGNFTTSLLDVLPIYVKFTTCLPRIYWTIYCQVYCEHLLFYLHKIYYLFATSFSPSLTLQVLLFICLKFYYIRCINHLTLLLVCHQFYSSTQVLLLICRKFYCKFDS
jgi:hypothetical protein